MRVCAVLGDIPSVYRSGRRVQRVRKEETGMTDKGKLFIDSKEYRRLIIQEERLEILKRVVRMETGSNYVDKNLLRVIWGKENYADR